MNHPLRALALLVATGALVAVMPSSSAQGDESTGRSKRGHGSSITEGLDCGNCHAETGWGTLGEHAGGGFDHARTGFPLSGRHRRVPCSDCHVAGNDISRECVTCHRDPHERRLGQACSDCHSAVSFKVNDAMQRHRMTRLPLTGMHALLDCTECHRRGSDRRFSSVPPRCNACHAREYRRSDIHPLHTGVPGDPTRKPFPTDCARCHRATGWSPAIVDPAQLRLALSTAALQAPREHELTFPIARGPHRQSRCESCHADVTRRPKQVRCTGCHAHDTAKLLQQHGGKAVARQGTACLACHPGGVAR